MALKQPVGEAQDPHLKSWVESANISGGDFPIQSLPFGLFQKRGDRDMPAIGVAIGDQVLDLRRCAYAHELPPGTAQACTAHTLNEFMALGHGHWSLLRRRLSQLLRAQTPDSESNKRNLTPFLVPAEQVQMLVPAVIGNYTDFYSSIHHASNVGKLFRPDNPLLPNYKYVPIAYHGRASSIVMSGTPVRRPSGQTMDAAAERPRFGPSQALDYELEVGFFVGPGNVLGKPIRIEHAPEQIFGLCLLNDWSARDIQSWEYQPLGPFLAKDFATTISPWIVPLEALEPFRAPAFERPSGDPEPLPYLNSASECAQGGIDLTLEAWILTQKMRESGQEPVRLCKSNMRELYWTIGQMLTHHASGGCNLRPGDLLATGTVSGPAPDARGCLLEQTQRGVHPVPLPGGEVRKFLEDGDEIILRGYCEREGFVRIGLGECRGRIAAADDP
jgi:fumarylacetoacetase